MSGDHNQYQKPGYVDRRQWKYDPLTGEPVAKYSDIVSDGGLDPRNKFDNVPEPVGWIYEDDEGRMMFSQMPHPDPLWEPVYRAKREWVGLTDMEAEQIIDEHWEDLLMLMEAIEARLKAKNG